MKKPRIAIILGTRPEIIKLYSTISYCENNRIDYILIHTNQHYSKNLDSVFFEDLGLPEPKYNLKVGSGSHAEQTAKMLLLLEPILEKESDVVVVQGDTNSVLAGALTGRKLGIPIAHVEAGLRSYDERMPEETNRIVTDHISHYLFCPTQTQKDILLSEGIEEELIHVVGNTVVDVVLSQKEKETDILERLSLEIGKYGFLTMHRPENVDNKERLEFLLYELSKLKLKIIFPMHPRTRKMLEKFNIEPPENIIDIEPTPYQDTITLMNKANIVLTDSGGIQEEACILQVPCVTLRKSTERPETVVVGANKIMTDNLGSDVDEMAAKNRDWENPFGDGTAGAKIIEGIIKDYDKIASRLLTR